MAWFFIQLASKDLTTQRKGLVTIYWLLGSRHAASDLASSQLGRNAAASIAPCFRAYPVRMAAIHLCFKETSFRYVFNFGTMVIERTTRVRCKAHVGKYPFLSHLLFSMMIMVSVSFSFVVSHHDHTPILLVKNIIFNLQSNRHNARSNVLPHVLRDTESHFANR